MSDQGAIDTLLKDIPQGILDQQCSDVYLADVAKKIRSWELLAPYFGISEGEKVSIKKDCICYEEERQKMLLKWKEKNGGNATNRALVEAIRSSESIDLLDNACQLLKQKLYHQSEEGSDGAVAVTTMSPVLAKFQSRLKTRYETYKPVMVTEWPPPLSVGYVKLVLVPKEKINKSDMMFHRRYFRLRYHDIDWETESVVSQIDIAECQEVHVDQLLAFETKKKHKIILFEGPPGSGKSTLLWHICQSWQSGLQFQHFSLVLLVQLKDPAFHTAKSLAGLVPFRSQDYSEKVASEIEEIEGEGVLILLDGWDEAPAELRQEGSFFHDLIAKPCDWGIEKAVIVVSSRPLASDRLWMYLSDRVELRGFTKEMREKYIKQALQDKPDAAQTLISKIESLEGTSDAMDVSLPLNVASLVHIAGTPYTELPSTPCRMAIKLLLSILLRHIRKARPAGISVEALESFEALPHPISSWFLNLCKIAYDGIVSEKFSFTRDELVMPPSIDPGSQLASYADAGEVIAMLGLLQPVHSVVESGFSTVYHFLHLSHQELFAAYHVSRLPNPGKRHIEALQLLGTPGQFHRFQSVCNFYSAITSLRMLPWDEVHKLQRSYSQCEDKLVGEFDFITAPFSLHRTPFTDLRNRRRQLAEQLKEPNMHSPYEQWEPLAYAFQYFDRHYVAITKKYDTGYYHYRSSQVGYKLISFLQFVMESRNIDLIDQVVDKQMTVQVDVNTEGTFSGLISMAPSLESVTYYMHDISPRIFTALKSKPHLKTFGLCIFPSISDCTDFKALKSSLETCPNLQDVFLRVKFSRKPSHVNLLAEAFQHVSLRNICIDAQSSLEDAEVAALAPAFSKKKCIRFRCKQIGPLGLEKLQHVFMQTELLDVTVEQYEGEDKNLFGCFKNSAVKTVVLRSKKCSPDDGEPSLTDSAVGRVLLSGDLVELAQIFGLNNQPTIDKTLHVHIFSCCLEIDFKNECFKFISLIDCQEKYNSCFKSEPTEIKNRIESNGVHTLCSSLQSIAVEVLHLFSQKIGNAGAVDLGKALPAAICLKELIIRECEIGEDGIASVFAGLTKNKTLTTLDAPYNTFGDSGAIQVAKLINKTSLEVLDIGSCGVGEEGMVAIAASLRTNTTLKKLSLYSKDQAITQRSEVELSRMLIENRTLLLLEVNQNDHYYWSRIHRNEFSRNFRVSHATLQTLLMDMDPEECYHAIKVSPIIARIGIESTSPLGQALIWDNMELAADILQLDQPPAAQGQVELKVDDDNVWGVNYSKKRVIEYRKQLKKESQEVVGGEGKQGVEGEGEKAKDEEGEVVAGITEVNKHASPVDEA